METHSSTPSHKDAGRLLSRQQAADMLGVREQTLRRWACERRGPSFVKVGALVRYRRDELLDYIERHAVRFETSAA